MSHRFYEGEGCRAVSTARYETRLHSRRQCYEALTHLLCSGFLDLMEMQVAERAAQELAQVLVIGSQR